MSFVLGGSGGGAAGLEGPCARTGCGFCGGGAAGVEALRGAARALAADFLAALASATTIVRLLKFSPNTGMGQELACGLSKS
eukprot:1159498-Pelagomonas_calceolata.AAC.4